MTLNYLSSCLHFPNPGLTGVSAMLGLPLSFLLKEFGTMACLSFGKGRHEAFPAYMRMQVAEMTELGTGWNRERFWR